MSTLIGTFKRAFVGSFLSALLFAALFVFWTYHPHPLFDMSIWSGLWAPKANAEGDPGQALRRADRRSTTFVQKKLSDLGGSVPVKADRSSAFFERYVTGEIARWHPMLKAASNSQATGGQTGSGL